MPLPPAWRELARTRFPDVPEDCGRTRDGGIFFDPPMRDWTHRRTTEDQYRIENYIDRFDLRSKRILHMGVGNSGLAKRFKGRFKEILGTTIDQPEVDCAERAAVPGYRALLHNKYDGDADILPGRFDFIVDNNPTSPCCCMRHLADLFDLYSAKLADGGQIVTDQQGLCWVPDNGIPEFRFDFDDLASVASLVGLSAYRANRNVYVLSRTPPPPPGTMPLLRHQLRSIVALPRTLLQRARRAAGAVRRVLRSGR